MKRLLLAIGLVLVIWAYFSFSGSTPYERLNDIESKYGLKDSMMPASEESTLQLKAELNSLKESLKDDESREAEAVKVLIEVRLDLAEAALRIFAAEKNKGAMSPFSNNCLPGKPAFEAKKHIDESVEKARNASERMRLFLSNYSSEAAKFGIKKNYAKEYADLLEESAIIEKNSLEAFC